MELSKLFAQCTSTSLFFAMVALMQVDGIFLPALILLAIGGVLTVGVCVFADWLSPGSM
jgi:hypothetical protein